MSSEKGNKSQQDLGRELKRLFGFPEFRENQEEIVTAILQGRDVFAVMPTGGGKSLCYQLPAAIMPGTCLVISPLISLMKDQVDSARSTGLKAGYLNSSMPHVERSEVIRRFREGGYDLFYMAPEGLASAGFQNLLSQAPVSLVAVDEAHCISEWGHDFRPDYLQLAKIKESFSSMQVAAFTATATMQVQVDILRRLCLDDPLIVRASFNRPNLFYSVIPKEAVLRQIEEFILEHQGESGIIYRLSRTDAEKTAQYLRDHGIDALPYHAGLDAAARHRHQEAFNQDDIQVIVATVAFGMGIDKSNVRFVIHGDMPKNIEGYYQETGRAGRDGAPAHCLLLYSRSDMMRLGHFIKQLQDRKEQQIAWKKLGQMVDFAEKVQCRRRMLLAYFDEEYPSKNCRACDVCIHGVEEVDATTEARMLMSAVYRTGQCFGASHIIEIVTGSRNRKILRLCHDKIKTHGVGRHRPKGFWRQLVDALLSRGCLETSGDRFPVLRITRQGEDVLFGRAEFSLKRLAAPEISGQDNVDGQGPQALAYDRKLFEILKHIRRNIAAKNNVPPFVVFSDRTLQEMCLRYPENPQEMLAVSGVGEAKLKHYCGPFMEAIRQHLASHPEIEKRPVQKLRNRKAKRASAGDTVYESGRLARQGMDLDEIARKRGLKRTTVVEHLEKFLQAGNSLDIGLFVHPEHQLKLTEAFQEHGTEFLKPVVESLNGLVTYEDAKIVRGYLLGRSIHKKPGNMTPWGKVDTQG